MTHAEQGSETPAGSRNAATERVLAWRKNNREKYNAYMRDYKKTEKARQGRKQRYYQHLEQNRSRARESMRKLRAKRKQQRIDIFPQQGQD